MLTNLARPQDAIDAAIAAGAVPPPRGPQPLYDQLFVQYQTATSACATNWLDKEFVEVASFFARDPTAHGAFVASQVYNRAHRNFGLSPTSSDLLETAAADAPGSASRFKSQLGQLLGQIVAEVPYSRRLAAAGVAKDADAGLPSQPRESKREATVKRSTATKKRQSGLIDRRLDDALNPVMEEEQPMTQQDFEATIQGDSMASLRKVVATLVSGTRKARADAIAKGVAISDKAIAPTAERDLLDDILRFLFILLAFIHRCIAISVNLTSSVPEKCDALTISALMGGGAPLRLEAFNKSLIGVTMKLREMRGLGAEDLLPVSSRS